MRELDAMGEIKRTLLEGLRLHGFRTFIETGTAGGVTVDVALEAGYERVVSIELNEGFYRMAAQRFLWDQRVRILHGDSAQLIGDVMFVLDEPAVFLLDAHYTGGDGDVRGVDGDTPVALELEHVLAHPLRHVVLVDDARLFGVDPAYPTIDEVMARAASAGYQTEVADDIIRLTPPDLTSDLSSPTILVADRLGRGSGFDGRLTPRTTE